MYYVHFNEELTGLIHQFHELSAYIAPCKSVRSKKYPIT